MPSARQPDRATRHLPRNKTDPAMTPAPAQALRLAPPFSQSPGNSPPYGAREGFEHGGKQPALLPVEWHIKGLAIGKGDKASGRNMFAHQDFRVHAPAKSGKRCVDKAACGGSHWYSRASCVT